MTQIIGNIIAVPSNSKPLDPKTFNKIGTVEDIAKDNLYNQILINYYIDYTDLKKRLVSKKESLLSWMSFYDVPDSSIFYYFGNFKGIYYEINKHPKTLKNDVTFYDIFKIKDKSIHKFITNKYGVPIEKNGYNYYNLDNHSIIPGLYYLINDKILRHTSVDINKIHILQQNNKLKLYKHIINKEIKLLKNG